MEIQDWKLGSLISIGIICVPMLAAAQTELQPAASCNRSVAGAACSVGWDFAATPRPHYWVERFTYETKNGKWEPVMGPFSDNKGKGLTEATVDGGYLYRVVGCRDTSKKTDCIGSTVFWAPLRPESTDDIPDTIYVSESEYYIRHKHLSDLEQVIGYNIATLRQLVDVVDMKIMPPMTDLPFDDLWDLPEGVDDDDATIDYNVQFVYPKHVTPLKH